MKRRIGTFVVLAMMGFAVSSFAQTGEVDQEGWRFKVTPYFLAAGLDGIVGFEGVTTNVDVPFDEVLDHLDAGFMLSGTARKDRWVLGFDAIYFKLSGAGSKQVTGPFGAVTVKGTVELDMTEQVYQPTIAYRVYETGTTLDVYAAGRYTGLSSEVTLTTTTTIPSLPGGTNHLDADKSWWDPVIGARTDIPLGQKFDILLLADFGGFGVGSDVTYQWLFAAGWQFSKHFDTHIGYRYFYEDYDQDGFKWDMVASGAIIGLGISF